VWRTLPADRPTAWASVRPLHGRPRRADAGAAPPGPVCRASAFGADLRAHAVPLGRQGLHRLPGRRPQRPGLRTTPPNWPRKAGAPYPPASWSTRAWPTSFWPSNCTRTCLRSRLPQRRPAADAAPPRRLRPRLLLHRQRHRRPPAPPRGQPRLTCTSPSSASACAPWAPGPNTKRVCCACGRWRNRKAAAGARWKTSCPRPCARRCRGSAKSWLRWPRCSRNTRPKTARCACWWPCRWPDRGKRAAAARRPVCVHAGRLRGGLRVLHDRHRRPAAPARQRRDRGAGGAGAHAATSR
jgi:hypothetical protein